MRIGVGGALGRMGQAVLELAGDHPGFEVAAAFGRPESIGARAAGHTLVTGETAAATCEVIVDFSTACATADLAMTAERRQGPALVLGATGLSGDELAVIARAARRIAIVRSGNFSIGVNLLAGLVEQASSRLAAADWDIEVFEAHHRRKRDAPSGTALMLGEAAAHGRGVSLAEVRGAAREGLTTGRRAGEIGFSVMRGGGIVGEHSVVFAAEEETITLSHSAGDRRLFARGALLAATWVAGRPAGLYDMSDVLGLRL